jgi:hypothetical protein
MEHAARGMVRSQARVASRPVVSWAEPETGGEAYVPKRGDYLRSMGVLSTAANWYGADVVPRGGMGGGATATAVDVRVRWEGSDSQLAQAFGDGLRFETTQVGNGSVQGHYGRRGRP